MSAKTLNYCRKKCYKQLWLAVSGVGLAAICTTLLISIVFYDVVYGDKFTTQVATYSSAAFILLAILFIYIGINEAVFPEKSSLAKSIRSQLKYKDDYYSVEKLFHMVDEDISNHGQWFGSFVIGKEWILETSAMRIDRLRGAFYQIESQMSNNNNQVHYTYKLLLVDNRKQEQAAHFNSENSMMLALQKLCILSPNIANGDYSEYKVFKKMSEEDERVFERRFTENNIKLEKTTENILQQQIVLYYKGVATSNINEETLKEVFLNMQGVDNSVRLRSTVLLYYQNNKLLFLDIFYEDNGFNIAFLFEYGEELLGYRKWLTSDDAFSLSMNFVKTKKIPDLSSWEQLTARYVDMPNEQPFKKPDIAMSVADKWSLEEIYTDFNRMDLEIALDDLFDGNNEFISLMLEEVFFGIERNDKDSEVMMVSNFWKENQRCDVQKAFHAEEARKIMLNFYDEIYDISNYEVDACMKAIRDFFPNPRLPDIRCWDKI